MKKYICFVLFFTLLVFSSACNNSAATIDPAVFSEEPVNEEPVVENWRAKRKEEWLARFSQEGWEWDSSSVCVHGSPFDHTDVSGTRPSTDGSRETVHFCFYNLDVFTP